MPHLSEFGFEIVYEYERYELKYLGYPLTYALSEKQCKIWAGEYIDRAKKKFPGASLKVAVEKYMNDLINGLENSDPSDYE